MLNDEKLYDFEDAQMFLVKLFASDETRHSCCHRIAESLHLSRLRAAYDPKLVPKTDLPKP